MWIDKDRYYIAAKATSPAGGHELMQMLRALLADRFKLVFHREQRTLSGYRLVLAKSGLKATSGATDSGSAGHLQRGRVDTCSACTMAQLAVKLAEVLKQPVVDATGVAGEFDFKLEWTPDDMQPKSSFDQRAGNLWEYSDGPSIFVALQQQLGLKLESAKLPIDVLVIDSAEKPSEN